MKQNAPMYPNEAVPDEVKNTKEYGKSVGAYIENQWFGKDSRYLTKRSEFQELRAYMKGNPNVKHFMDLYGIDKDSSNSAISWEPIRTIARFVNDVVDSISEEITSIKAIGIDPINNMRRQVYTDNLKMAMVTSAFTQQMSQVAGINMGMNTPVPESDDELDLHMQMDYHTLSEISAEAAINGWMDLNDYDEIKKQADEDLVLLGEGGVRVKRNGDRVTYERCVPENMIYGEDTHQARDGRGTNYYGHVKAMSVGDFKHFCSSHGDEVTDEQINKFVSVSKKLLATGEDENSMAGSERYGDDRSTILVIDMCYKTTNNLTYKKKYNRYGGHKLIEKPSDFKTGKNYEKLQQEYDVWYEGLYVVGAGEIFGYQKMNNQVRKRSNLKEPLQPIVYYRLSTESIGKRIRPYVEQMYITYIGIQKHISKMKPDGVAVDISGLTDIDLMDGTKYTAAQIIKIYNETGDLLYDGSLLGGEGFQPRMPITEIPKPVTGKLQELINTYLHWLNMIQMDTGINEARSAIAPDPNAPVATQKMALASSMNSTKHIARGVLNITKRVAEATLMHSQMMARNGILCKQLANAIGAYNANVLEEITKLGEYEYQIRLELAPTIEEVNQFNAEMQLAIQRQAIGIDDVIDIRSIGDIKLARKILKVKAQKRIKLQQQAAQQQAQIEAQAQQMKTQLKIQEDTAISQNKMQVDRNKIILEGQVKVRTEYDILMLKMKAGDPDLKNKMLLKDRDAQIQMDKIKATQDRIDKRSDRTKTQESKLREQMKDDNVGAQNFEQSQGDFNELFDFKQ